MAFSPTVIPLNKVTLEPMEAPRCTSVGSHTQSASRCNLPSAVVARVRAIRVLPPVRFLLRLLADISADDVTGLAAEMASYKTAP